MSDVIVVALISLAGSVLGTVAGMLAAYRLSNYRIEQLEKKVDKHDMVAQRMAVLERDVHDLRWEQSAKRLGGDAFTIAACISNGRLQPRHDSAACIAQDDESSCLSRRGRGGAD